jgi:hypothetical protein
MTLIINQLLEQQFLFYNQPYKTKAEEAIKEEIMLKNMHFSFGIGH